jgi:hypothetical protein
MVLRRLLDAGVAIIALEPLESPLEQLYTRAVRAGSSLPLPESSTDHFERPVHTPSLPPIAAPAAQRLGEGDTLLNELLRRGGDQESDQSPENKEQGTGTGHADPEA